MKEVFAGEAWERKYPEAVVLVTSVDRNGKANIISLGWSMCTSFQPPMLAISIGKTRYSHNLVSENKEFVLAFPSEELAEAVLYCGTHSGRDVDKFRDRGLTAVKAKRIAPPLIEECIANFECKVVGELDTGDHTIFAGEILAAYVSEKKKKRLFTAGKGYKFTGL